MPPSAAFAKGEMLQASFEEPKAGGLHPGAAQGVCGRVALPLPSSPSPPQCQEKGPKYLSSPADSHLFSLFSSFSGLKRCSRAPPALGTPRRPGPGEPLPLSPPRCPSAEDHARDRGTAARSGTGKRGFLAFPPSSVS